MSGAPKTTTAATTTNTDTSVAPWKPVQPYLLNTYKKGSKALDLTNNKPFMGDFVAPATPGQRSSIEQLYGAAPGLSTGSEDLRTMAGRIAGGEFLDPNNPTLQAGISSVQSPLLRQLQEQVLPGITDAAMRGGAYAGTANAQLNAQAISDWEQNSGNIGSKMTLDWMNSRFGDIFQAPGLFQGANTLALAPGTVTGMAGEAERGFNQLGNEDALKRYENRQTAPWFGLSDFVNMLTAGGFRNQTGETTGTTTSTGAAPDMMTQILQGVTGGAGMLSSLGKAFPATMGAIGSGSVMGPILSGLSFLSDRRFKTDITKIGVADNGLPIYRFRYINSPAYQIGFMADEVEKVNPAAVYEHGGVKFVDYHAATEII